MTQQVILPHEPVPSAVAVPQLSGECLRDDRVFCDYHKTKAGQWIIIPDRLMCEHRGSTPDAIALAAVSQGLFRDRL